MMEYSISIKAFDKYKINIQRVWFIWQMKAKGRRAKIFLLKNQSETKKTSYLNNTSEWNKFTNSNGLSSFQSLYMNKGKVTRQKDIIHLSTLLQKDKKMYELLQYPELQQLVPQTFNNKKGEKNQSIAAKQQEFLNKCDKDVSNLKVQSNYKRAIFQRSIAMPSKQHGQSMKIGFQEPSKQPLHEMNLKKISSSEHRFYTISLQIKNKKQKSLAYIFREKWNEQKLKTKLQQTEQIFKSTFAHASKVKKSRKNFFSDRSKQIQEENLRQTKRGLKQNFLKFVQISEAQVYKRKDRKIQGTKSQKILPEQRSVILSNKQQNLSNSVRKVNNFAKIKIIPANFKRIFSTESAGMQGVQKSQNLQNLGQYRRQKKDRRQSNSVLSKKKKSIFLPSQNQQKTWWSKDEIVQKTGQSFELKKTIIG